MIEVTLAVLAVLYSIFTITGYAKECAGSPMIKRMIEFLGLALAFLVLFFVLLALKVCWQDVDIATTTSII